MQKTLLSKEKMRRYNADILIVCIGLTVVGIFNNGAAAFYQIAMCLLSSVVSEIIAFGIILKKNTLTDLSAAVSGLIIALLLPACAPLWVGVIACAVAVFIGKLPFGDSRNAPFLPAAVGFCFVAMLFPSQVFTYSAVTDGVNTLFSHQNGFIKGTTLSEMLKTGDSLSGNIFSLTSLFSGRIPGATGTTSLFALIGAFCYLLIRQTKNLLPSLGFILTTIGLATVFPTAKDDLLISVIMHLGAGSLLFVAVVMLSSPVHAPEGGFRAFLYGALAGIVAMLLRYFAKVSDPVVFSVMIINALMPVIFRSSSRKKGEKEKKKTDTAVKKEVTDNEA